MSDCVVEMRNITKTFPGIVANDKINLTLKKGEIHALLGENGAGKSTLMSVLFGLYQPDEGEIFVNGEAVSINNPNDANALGIGMVHQHFKLVEVFTVTENIILGNEPTKYGILNTKNSREKIIALSEKYKLKIDPDEYVENITVGQQQKVEILRMLYRDNDVLIFDEPTAVLTPQETDELMLTMRNFAREGKSILFITHKLNEIMAVADRCTVLRKGKYIGTVNIKDTNKHELAKMMVGRDIDFQIDKKDKKVSEKVLEVNSLCVINSHSKKHTVNNVSFDVKAGEIVCVAGIEGNGQNDLIYALSGLIKSNSGNINLLEQSIDKLSIRNRNKLGMSYIPEDRHKYGLVLDFSLADNLALKEYYRKPFTNKFGFINFYEIDNNAKKLIERFDIRSGQGAKTIARSMSGGNQQKAIVAREIAYNPKLLIAVQPTRGLDVGAIENIHKEIVLARDAGCAVLLVSYELDEVMNLSDRILVIYEGKIVFETAPNKTNVQELGLYMAGHSESSKKEKQNDIQ